VLLNPNGIGFENQSREIDAAAPRRSAAETPNAANPLSRRAGPLTEFN
jgi:hypothetical protein